MGREIRMVPPNWDHPKKQTRRFVPGVGYREVDEYQPMHDQTFESAAAEWKDGFAKWERGERPEYADKEDRALEYWEWSGNPPERQHYRPWKDEEATWFQLWETVSEGTPVSPPFATREELANYLAEHGDFWDQARGNGGWSKKSAEAFVKSGWAPSMAVVGGRVVESKDVAAVLGSDAKGDARG